MHPPIDFYTHWVQIVFNKTPLNAFPLPTGKASTAQEQGKAMISPTGNIYCDFYGREQAECGPVTANNGMGGRCHICTDCALRSIASRLGKTEKMLLQRPQSEDCPYREEENCATHHHSCQICWRTMPR